MDSVWPTRYLPHARSAGSGISARNFFETRSLLQTGWKGVQTLCATASHSLLSEFTSAAIACMRLFWRVYFDAPTVSPLGVNSTSLLKWVSLCYAWTRLLYSASLSLALQNAHAIHSQMGFISLPMDQTIDSANRSRSTKYWRNTLNTMSTDIFLRRKVSTLALHWNLR